jgi:hypothetical protein
VTIIVTHHQPQPPLIITTTTEIQHKHTHNQPQAEQSKPQNTRTHLTFFHHEKSNRRCPIHNVPTPASTMARLSKALLTATISLFAAANAFVAPNAGLASSCRMGGLCMSTVDVAEKVDIR